MKWNERLIEEMIKAVTKQKDKTLSTFCWWPHVVCAICGIWLRERGRACNKNHNGYKMLLQIVRCPLERPHQKRNVARQSTRNRTAPLIPFSRHSFDHSRSIGKIRLMWKTEAIAAPKPYYNCKHLAKNLFGFRCQNI